MHYEHTNTYTARDPDGSCTCKGNEKPVCVRLYIRRIIHSAVGRFRDGRTGIMIVSAMTFYLLVNERDYVHLDACALRRFTDFHRIF